MISNIREVLVFRGYGGWFALVSPLVVALFLHFLIVAILLGKSNFVVLDHLWSAGLSLSLAGLLTMVVIDAARLGGYGEIEKVATEEEEEVTTGVGGGEDDDRDDSNSRQYSFSLPQTPSEFYQYASRPVSSHHLYHVAPNQIAAFYVVMGLVLILVAFYKLALILLVLVPVAFFFKVMVYDDAPPVVVADESVDNNAASGGGTTEGKFASHGRYDNDDIETSSSSSSDNDNNELI